MSIGSPTHALVGSIKIGFIVAKIFLKSLNHQMDRSTQMWNLVQVTAYFGQKTWNKNNLFSICFYNFLLHQAYFLSLKINESVNVLSVWALDMSASSDSSKQFKHFRQLLRPWTHKTRLSKSPGCCSSCKFMLAFLKKVRTDSIWAGLLYWLISALLNTDKAFLNGS